MKTFLITAGMLAGAIPVHALESVAQLPAYKGVNAAADARLEQMLACSNQRKFYNSTTGTCIGATVKGHVVDVPALLFRDGGDDYNKTTTINLSDYVPADATLGSLKITHYNVGGNGLNMDYEFDIVRGTARSWDYNINSGSDNYSWVKADYDGANQMKVQLKANDYGYAGGIKAATIKYFTIE